MKQVFTDVENVIDQHTGLCRTVLDYSVVVKRIVDSSKQPGFSVHSWAPLAELVNTAEFSRVGNFKEHMDWAGYVDFLTSWASAAEWEGSFKRVTEHDGVVFLELEERSTMGDFKSVVNSMSVYEFDEAGKIVHIDVYLQMALPGMDTLGSYDGIQITE